jgi:hypothetical protein
MQANQTETDGPRSLDPVVGRRWNEYAVWRKQRSDYGGTTNWILTGHKLKALSDKDAQSRLKRCFEGCGFSEMSLVSMPVGESPNDWAMPRRTKNAKKSLKTPTRRWHQRIVRRLKRLSNEMLQVGEDMDYYGGFGEIGQHGREMISASQLALDWARNIEKLKSNE